MATLMESILWAGKVRALHEGTEGSLSEALADLVAALGPDGWAMIGGLAVGFHARPRGTQDVDVLLATEQAIDGVTAKLRASDKFTRHRSHAVEHRATGVEIELRTPEFLGFANHLAEQAIDTAEHQRLGEQTVPVVNRNALVALKLQRHSRADQGDIERIIQAGGAVDLSSYEIPADLLELYQQIEREVLG